MASDVKFDVPSGFASRYRVQVSSSGSGYSLTLQVALSLGQAAERRGVGKDMKVSAKHARDNWNEIPMEALSDVASEPAGTVIGGGFF